MNYASQNKNANNSKVSIVWSAILIIILVILGFRFNIFDNISDFFNNGSTQKVNLEIVENSLKTSVDPYDWDSTIVSGKVKNTSNVTVDNAIVTVYYLDGSGVEHIVDSIEIKNIGPKETQSFKTRLSSYRKQYGVSEIHARVKWYS